MTTSILIPYRGDGGQRERLWKHCKQLWDQLPYEVVIGADSGDGPFSAAQAFNDAHSRATGDKIIVYGADQLPDVDAIEDALNHLDTHPWIALYGSTALHTAEATFQILAGITPTHEPQTVPTCVAIVGVRSDKWINYDERFRGWGSEDTAWRYALQAMYGETPAPHRTLHALYHKPSSRQHAEDNYRLLLEYMDANNSGRMREYLEAHGLIKGKR